MAQAKKPSKDDTMPRTDAHGRDLLVALGYLLNRTLSSPDVYRALGISRNTYAVRSQQPDFPNAEECRLIADHYGLNPLFLWEMFGWIAPDHREEYLDVHRPLRPATEEPSESSLALQTDGKVELRTIEARTIGKFAGMRRRSDRDGV